MIKLTDKEIRTEQDSFRKRDREFGMMTWTEWIVKAQLKKVVEYIEKKYGHRGLRYDGNVVMADAVIIEKEEWQSLLKEAGLKAG